MYGDTSLTLFFSRQGTKGKWKVFLKTVTLYQQNEIFLFFVAILLKF